MYKALFIFFILFYSHVGNACSFTVIDDIKIIEESCSLPIVLEVKTGHIYYFQIVYTKNIKIAFSEIKMLRQKLNVSVAMQSYKSGYRLLIGPITPVNFTQISDDLLLLGYKNLIIKRLEVNPLINESIEQSSPYKTNIQNENSRSDWIVFGELNNRMLLIPYTKKGSLMTYKSFEFKNVCQAFSSMARIATQDEYFSILSSLPAAEKLGLKYRFWLNDGRTMTRVLKQVIVQDDAQSTQSRALICTMPVML